MHDKEAISQIQTVDSLQDKRPNFFNETNGKEQLSIKRCLEKYSNQIAVYLESFCGCCFFIS